MAWWRHCTEELYYSGLSRHKATNCPELQEQRKKQPQGENPNSLTLPIRMPKIPYMPAISLEVQIIHLNKVFDVTAMIEPNLIDREISEELQRSLHLLDHQPQVCAIDDSDSITHRTAFITLQTSWLHKEQISLLVTESSKHHIFWDYHGLNSTSHWFPGLKEWLQNGLKDVRTVLFNLCYTSVQPL